MNLFDVNIKLMMMFDEIYRTRSVSRTADILGMSQPTISIGLNKLRAHYGDPLFVRTSAGMEPTPHAQHLALGVRRTLEMLNQTLGAKLSFSPRDSERTFRIGLTDTTQLVMLPPLLQKLKVEAPRVNLVALRVTEETLRSLESGEADFLVGYLPNVSGHFYEQTLLMRDFVCIASATHPRIRDGISMKAFNAEQHVATTASGSGLRHAELVLENRKVRRHVKVHVPDLTSVGAIVAHSDLIATVPRPVGMMFARQLPVKLHEHPVKLPTYPVKLHWHERYQLDPGNQWLRRIVAELMTSNGREPNRG